jgi:probable phosphoglycerate mutase
VYNASFNKLITNLAVGYRMTKTIVDLLRHGEPEGGRAYRGHTLDDPLSAKGWQQMWAAVEGAPDWSVIISSPMQRCMAFARQLAEKLKLPVQEETALQEVGFGHWEGHTPEEVKTLFGREYEDFYRDPVNARPQGAETLEEFYARVTTIYEKLLQQHANQKILIVAHAGVNRAIISHILQAPLASMYRLKIANAGISRIEYGEQGAQLTRHNCRFAEI